MASSTAGALTTANLKTNELSEVWRSTGTTATLTFTWSQYEDVGGVALGWTNMTSTATVTIDVFAEAADVTPIGSMTVGADVAMPMGEFNWGLDPLMLRTSQAAGLATQAQAWFYQSMIAKKVVITLSDPDNTDGYVQVTKACIGPMVSLSTNPGYGVRVEFVDRGKSTRTESGSLRCEPRGVYRKITVDYRSIVQSDTHTLLSVLHASRVMPIFMSVFPSTGDLRTQMYSIFAMTMSQINNSYVSPDRWDFQAVTFEEIA